MFCRMFWVLFGEVSQHARRMQTVNARCVSLAFPIEKVLGLQRKTLQGPVHGVLRECFKPVTFCVVQE